MQRCVDEAGKVRIWAWTRADHLLKLEVAFLSIVCVCVRTTSLPPSQADVLGGPVEDLSWDFENKRLFAVGAGSK
jgi:hypothetical protein